MTWSPDCRKDDFSQEILAIDVFTALKSSVKHRCKDIYCDCYDWGIWRQALSSPDMAWSRSISLNDHKH